MLTSILQRVLGLLGKRSRPTGTYRRWETRPALEALGGGLLNGPGSPLAPSYGVSMRPGVEVLEERILPATEIWNPAGANHNWSLDSNWSGNAAPGPNDTAILSDANTTECIVDQAKQVGKLKITNGYNGNFKINATLQVTGLAGTSFNDRIGANVTIIFSNNAALDLYDTTDWYGGTGSVGTAGAANGAVNVGTNAFLYLHGGNLKLGVPLNVGDSTGTGTVVFTTDMTANLALLNNTNIVDGTATNYGVIHFYGSYGVTPATGTSPVLQVNSLGLVDTGTGSPTVTNNLKISVQGANGLLDVESGTLSTPISQSNGLVVITGGATLQIAGNYDMTGGTLQCYGAGQATLSLLQTDGTVDTLTVESGAEVMLGAGLGTGSFNTLYVIGNVDFLGGLYLALDGTAPNEDQLVVSGETTLVGTFVLANVENGPPTASGQVWDFIVSSGGFQGLGFARTQSNVGSFTNGPDLGSSGLEWALISQ